MFVTSSQNHKKTTELDAWEYCKRGKYKMYLGKYDEAIADCRKAIVLDPYHVLAYFVLGNCKICQGKYDEAIAGFDKAIEIDPNFAEGYYNRGGAKAAQGDYEEALADYNKVRELKGNYKEVHKNITRANRKLGSGKFLTLAKKTKAKKGGLKSRKQRARRRALASAAA